MTKTFNPVKTRKKTFELVADEIREAILSRDVKAGERLPSERELAIQMGVGRAVVRESLRTLEASGLVYIKPGADGGIFVKELNAACITKSFSDLIRMDQISIADLTEARLMIEQLVLELIVNRAKEEDFKVIDELLASASKKVERGEKIRSENLQFHIELARIAGNSLLLFVLSSIVAIIEAFVKILNPTIEHTKRILQAHKQIVMNLKRRNLSASKKSLASDLLYFAEEFRTLHPIKSITFDEIDTKGGYL